MVAFTLLRPGFWWDMIYAPLQEVKATRLEQIVEQTDAGAHLMLEVAGEDFRGRPFTKSLMLQVGNQPTAAERLMAIGIETYVKNGRLFVDNVVFSSPAEKAGMDFDQEILHIYVPAKIPPKHLMFIPAFLLLACVWFLQRGRSRRLAAA
jgi:hypothetical protein